jgi:hypothetical protein
MFCRSLFDANLTVIFNPVGNQFDAAVDVAQMF